MLLDLWTTRCTRCPAALDRLNDEAAAAATSSTSQRSIDSSLPTIQFVSICMGDKIDSARQILQEPDEPRWSNMEHYFMDFQTKERAKELLNFKTVPFYVVSNAEGHLVHTGTKIDLETLPGRIPEHSRPELNFDSIESDVSSLSILETVKEAEIKSATIRSTSPNRIFEIDEMDF